MQNLFYNLYNLISNRFFFKLFYLTVTLLGSTIFYLVPGVNLSKNLLTVWGIILIPIILYKRIKENKHFKFYEIFVFSFIALTLILTIINYPTINNIKYWLINCILLLSFFLPDSTQELKSCLKEIKVVTYIFTIITFFFTSISLIMHLFNITINISNDLIFQTAYTHENTLGLAAILSMLLSLYLLVNFSSSLYTKAFNIINIFIQLCASVMLGGRSSFIVLLTLLFLLVFIRFKSIFIRLFLILAPILTIGYYLKANISTLYLVLTGREILWKIAFKVIKDQPFIGVGNSNMINALNEAGNFQELPGLELGGLHNIYIQTAVTNGIISSILLILILASILIFVIRKYDTLPSKVQFKLIPLLAIMVSLPLVGMLESVILYTMSFISIAFWIYSNYLISLINTSSDKINK